MFKIICEKCGKERIVEAKLESQEDSISIYIFRNTCRGFIIGEHISIECDCGNEISV